MNIACCYQCENRHEKCHAHCEEYHTQKILKIMVESVGDKKRKVENGIINQISRGANKARHNNYLRRRK